MIRILKIHGRTEKRRHARLARVEAWMGEAGWRLADYAAEAHSAMFERPADATPLPLFHATRWMPGPRALTPREWLHTARADPRLLGVPGAALVVLAVILLSWLAPPSFLDQQALKQQSGEQWRIVAANQLNVREAPSVNAQQVGVLYRNQRVLIEGTVDKIWVRISVPARGYVAARFLKEEPAPGTAPRSEPAAEPQAQPQPARRAQSTPATEPTPPAAVRLKPAPEPPQPAAEKRESAPEPPQPAAQKRESAPEPPAPAGRYPEPSASGTGSGAQTPPPPPAAPALPIPPPALPGSPPALPPPPTAPAPSQ